MGGVAGDKNLIRGGKRASQEHRVVWVWQGGGRSGRNLVRGVKDSQQRGDNRAGKSKLRPEQDRTVFGEQRRAPRQTYPTCNGGTQQPIAGAAGCERSGNHNMGVEYPERGKIRGGHSPDLQDRRFLRVAAISAAISAPVSSEAPERARQGILPLPALGPELIRSEMARMAVGMLRSTSGVARCASLLLPFTRALQIGKAGRIDRPNAGDYCGKPSSGAPGEERAKSKEKAPEKL